MPFEYIIAIICGSIFLILFIANLIVYFLNAKKEAAVYEELEKMYSDKNLVKIDIETEIAAKIEKCINDFDISDVYGSTMRF